MRLRETCGQTRYDSVGNPGAKLRMNRAVDIQPCYPQPEHKLHPRRQTGYPPGYDLLQAWSLVAQRGLSTEKPLLIKIYIINLLKIFLCIIYLCSVWQMEIDLRPLLL